MNRAQWISFFGRNRLALGMALVAIGAGCFAWAQRPPLRRHRAVGTRPLRLVPATERPPAVSRHSIEEHDDGRQVLANGIPDHPVGRFPNRGNPHGIRAQRYRFALPANPRPAERITRPRAPAPPFGIAVNGVLFDPGTAEFWNGDPRAGWNYEALGGAVGLGIDENHAHVQPGGKYHYHGLPTLLLEELGLSAKQHSPLVGWAADGFPIYALYGYRDADDPDSGIVELRSSYRLKSGRRPGGQRGPGGKYDGTFVEDYRFVDGAGDLDECNGRFCQTPEFPGGSYAYFLTRDWPAIPRAYRGRPVNLRGRRPPR